MSLIDIEKEYNEQMNEGWNDGDDLIMIEKICEIADEDEKGLALIMIKNLIQRETEMDTGVAV